MINYIIKKHIKLDGNFCMKKCEYLDEVQNKDFCLFFNEKLNKKYFKVERCIGCIKKF